MVNDPHRWFRRSLTIPLYLSAAIVSSVVLPAVLCFTATIDVLRRQNLAWSRAALFVMVYLYCEVWGILSGFLLWVGRPMLGEAGFLHANHTLQRRWSGVLIKALIRLFAIRLEVEGASELAGGPLLLLVRHTSMIDTVLPMHLVAVPHQYRARYVLKAELLRDPCLDIVGNRIENTFVRRGAGAGEAAAVAKLGVDLPDDGLVVIFPEGTRYSSRRRDRRLAEMVKKGDALVTQATALTHTLPPRTGGVLGLLEAAPKADVAFCVHTGLEGIQGFSQLTALVGRRIRVAFWRVSSDDIPDSPEQRRRWLFEEWAAVDNWIAQHHNPQKLREACKATALPAVLNSHTPEQS